MRTSKSLEHFIRAIDSLKVKESLYLVLLFGSYARGDERFDSDIDLLIVTKARDAELHDRIIDMVDDAMASTGYEELLSPHVIPLDHYRLLKERETDFYRLLCNEGRELWKAA